MKYLFWTVVSLALLASANATYDLLANYVGLYPLIALAAAVSIDIAATWMGHHTTVLARLGDNTRTADIATWSIILISFAVNFTHGFTEGGSVGGFVGSIFPILAAMLYHFYSRHTIRETQKAKGRILPEPPVYKKWGKYQDKARQEAIERDYINLTYETAEAKLSQMRRMLVPRETRVISETGQVMRQVDTRVPRQIETTRQDNETRQRDKAETRQISETRQEDKTVRQDNATTRDNAGQKPATITEIVRQALADGPKSLNEIDEIVRKVRPDLKRATLRKTYDRQVGQR